MAFLVFKLVDSPTCRQSRRLKNLLQFQLHQVAGLEDSSLASAVSEVLSLYYVLELFGLSEVIARAEVAADLSKKESSEKVEAAEGVVKEVLADLSVRMEVVKN